MQDKIKAKNEERVQRKKGIYKSHFGPEQTDEVIENLWNRKKSE